MTTTAKCTRKLAPTLSKGTSTKTELTQALGSDGVSPQNYEKS